VLLVLTLVTVEVTLAAALVMLVDRVLTIVVLFLFAPPLPHQALECRQIFPSGSGEYRR